MQVKGWWTRRIKKKRKKRPTEKPNIGNHSDQSFKLNKHSNAELKRKSMVIITGKQNFSLGKKLCSVDMKKIDLWTIIQEWTRDLNAMEIRRSRGKTNKPEYDIKWSLPAHDKFTSSSLFCWQKSKATAAFYSLCHIHAVYSFYYLIQLLKR